MDFIRNLKQCFRMHNIWRIQTTENSQNALICMLQCLHEINQFSANTLNWVVFLLQGYYFVKYMFYVYMCDCVWCMVYVCRFHRHCLIYRTEHSLYYMYCIESKILENSHTAKTIIIKLERFKFGYSFFQKFFLFYFALLVNLLFNCFCHCVFFFQTHWEYLFGFKIFGFVYVKQNRCWCSCNAMQNVCHYFVVLSFDPF